MGMNWKIMGFGMALCVPSIYFLARGFDFEVYGLDRNEKRSQDVLDNFGLVFGAYMQFYKCDVSSEEDVKSCIETVLEDNKVRILQSTSCSTFIFHGRIVNGLRWVIACLHHAVIFLDFFLYLL